MKKICITICTNRDVKPQTVKSLADMIAYTKYDVFTLIAQEGYTIAENRNYAVAQAKKEACTHILFVDDDMEFPEDTLDELMEHGVEIVGVDSKSRKLPLSTTVGLLKDNELWALHNIPPFYKMPEELFEVYSIGMGVALIDMKIFDEIDQPWFAFKTHDSGLVLEGEDSFMCQQARSKGYKVWCDPTIEIGHIGDYVYADY